MKPGRNDPCPCGSGKKYKKCCSAKDEAQRSADFAAESAQRAAAAIEAEATDESDEESEKAARPNPGGGPRSKLSAAPLPNSFRRGSV